MRSNFIGMSGAVAALAVASWASATTIDPFTLSASSASSDSYLQRSTMLTPGYLFDSRLVDATGYSTPSGSWSVSCASLIAAGSFSVTTTQTSASGTGYSDLNPAGGSVGWFNKDATSTDLSGLQSFTFNYTGASCQLSIALDTQVPAYTETFDGGDPITYMKQAQFTMNLAGGTGMPITINAASFDWGTDGDGAAITPSWSGITGLYVSFSRTEYGSVGESWTMSMDSFNANFVPAPGAAALLGAAGLVGGRRRKA